MKALLRQKDNKKEDRLWSTLQMLNKSNIRSHTSYGSLLFIF